MNTSDNLVDLVDDDIEDERQLLREHNKQAIA
jgi:hypothetical protein